MLLKIRQKKMEMVKHERAAATSPFKRSTIHSSLDFASFSRRTHSRRRETGILA
jgi:hypothetical protein